MREAVWRLLQSGGTLVCANAHAARAWTDWHNRQISAAGAKSWERARISTLPDWLQARTPTPVLSPAQEGWLWNDILVRHAPGAGPLAAAVPLAMSAWKLTQDWKLPLDGSEWNESDGTAAFCAWAREMRQWCRRQDWITAAELPSSVATAWQTGRADLPARLGLLGFDRFTPQQLDLIAALRQHRSEVVMLEPDAAPAPLALYGPPDPDRELRWAAQWALERKSHGTVGIVVPDLAARRPQVEVLFHEVANPRGEAGTPAFHLSLGAPLARHPLARAALCLLDWTMDRRERRAADGYELLRSPFLRRSDSDRDRRSLLEAALRRQGWEFLESGALEPGITLPAADWRQARHFSSWMLTFSNHLDAAGWPGERSLSSYEMQALGAWQRLCSELARLDQVAPHAVAAETALSWLHLHAARQMFQPEVKGAPVEVMGLEAGGLQFDHLWVCGLHDGAVPAAPAPHPLLPMAWQREREVPHATAAVESAFANRAFDRLRRSCTHIAVSYPQRDGDTNLRRSPLLDAAQPLTSPIPYSTPPPSPWEKLPDDAGPILNEHEWVTGGSDVVRAQSVCAFQAFARHRLGARPLEAIPTGIPATVRGQLMHKVLEDAWGQLQSHTALVAMTPARRKAMLKQLAERAVRAERLFANRPQLAQLEIKRLVNQIIHWLIVESDRKPFRVRKRELPREVRLGPLTLRVQLDRIDDLEEGGWLLIDYKSSVHAPADWQPPRPWEPQLPLYLITSEDAQDCAGIAFAQLKPGAMKLRGLTRTPHLLAKTRIFPWAKDWDRLAATWRTDLTALAEAFQRGAAMVAPIAPRACAYCGLQALCRIAPRAPEADDENTDDSDAG